MDWFPLNFMSPKVIVKMHRKGKGWFSSQKNGLIQPILKPTQILIHCHSSHKNQSGKLITCTTSPSIMNWGEKPEDWKICLNQPDGRSHLVTTMLQCRNNWVHCLWKQTGEKDNRLLFASAFYFSPEENALRKSQAAFKLHGCQG